LFGLEKRKEEEKDIFANIFLRKIKRNLSIIFWKILFWKQHFFCIFMGAKEELFFENVVEIKTIFIIFCQKITKKKERKNIYIRFSISPLLLSYKLYNFTGIRLFLLTIT